MNTTIFSRTTMQWLVVNDERMTRRSMMWLLELQETTFNPRKCASLVRIVANVWNAATFIPQSRILNGPFAFARRLIVDFHIQIDARWIKRPDYLRVGRSKEERRLIAKGAKIVEKPTSLHTAPPYGVPNASVMGISRLYANKIETLTICLKTESLIRFYKPSYVNAFHGLQRCIGRVWPFNAATMQSKKLIIANTSRSIFSSPSEHSTQHGPSSPTILWQTLSGDDVSVADTIPSNADSIAVCCEKVVPRIILLRMSTHPFPKKEASFNEKKEDSLNPLNSCRVTM